MFLIDINRLAGDRENAEAASRLAHAISEVKLDKLFEGATSPPRPGGLHQAGRANAKSRKNLRTHN